MDTNNGHKIMHSKTKTNTELPQIIGITLTIDQLQQNHRLRTDSRVKMNIKGDG